MAKKKSIKIEAQVSAPTITNEAPPVQNGLSDAIGFGEFGFPGNQGTPWSTQVSDTTTIFKNLRWYLISNFRQVLSEAYVELGLIQTIVDVPVDDALRGGIEIISKQLDEDEIKQLQISIDRDDDLGTAGQAAKWNRLFGGAGILIMTDQDPETELDLDLITKDSPLEFRAVDMWELFWDKQNTEGYDPEIQTEEFEFYNYYAQNIHKSRVMRLKGFIAPSFIRPRLRGWGFSVVEVLVRSINQYLKATDLSFEVLDEFKIDVYKVKNLVNTLLSPNGDQAVKKRIQLANWQKNYQNAVVMDSEDDWDHKQLSFAGLAEAQAGIRKQVCSDLRMPATKVFGSSENGGLGNTDQNDMENYNSMVESQVRNKLKYDILRMVEIKCMKLFGEIPDDLEIKFKPLRVLTSEQEENVKTQKFNRALQAKAANEITTFEFRETVNKGNLLDIQLDTKGDELNPDDPEIEQLVSEGSQAAIDEKSKDVDDPGANREDTRKPRAWDSKPRSKTPTNPVDRKDKTGNIPPDRVPTQTVKTNASFGVLSSHEEIRSKPLTALQKTRRLINSSAFDRASYAADGGDDWIDERRAPLFENPGNVDEALWMKAKDASEKAFGKIKWQFVTWWYKKQGG